MQLVQLGDAAAEEKLTMLAHRNTAAVLEPEAKPILEMLCCGLCGTPPAYATLMASPYKQPGRGRQLSPRGGAADSAASGAAVGEAGEQSGGEAAAAPAPVLFQTSVTLPAAYFPPERFHVAGVSMPLDVFVGPALPSEQAACAAASLQALMELHRLGIIVRYWPSRLLLAQHLLPRTAQADASPAAPAEPSAAAGLSGQPLFLGMAAAATPAGAIAAAEWAPGGGLQAPGPVPGGNNTANFFCPLCNVAATGHKVGRLGWLLGGVGCACDCRLLLLHLASCYMSSQPSHRPDSRRKHDTRAAVLPEAHPCQMTHEPCLPSLLHRPLTRTCAASATSAASSRRSCCSRARRCLLCCGAYCWRSSCPLARASPPRWLHQVARQPWVQQTRRCRERACRRWQCGGRT